MDETGASYIAESRAAMKQNQASGLGARLGCLGPDSRGVVVTLMVNEVRLGGWGPTGDATLGLPRGLYSCCTWPDKEFGVGVRLCVFLELGRSVGSIEARSSCYRSGRTQHRGFSGPSRGDTEGNMCVHKQTSPTHAELT